MKKFYLLMLGCIYIIAAVSCPDINWMPVDSNTADTTYRIIPADANTYGYEIFIDAKLLIRQKNIPGLSGNTGFSTKAAAVSVAQLVIRKLQQGMMPPTVTLMELKEMGIKL